MKKCLSMLMAAAVLLSSMAVPISANDEIKLVAFGSRVECDQPPVVVEGRTLVPLRAAAEAVGAEVNWNGETKTVHIKSSSSRLQLTIGADQMALINEAENNSVSLIPLDVSAQIINDRTMLPVRAVAEGLKLNVDWDADTKTVSISANDDSSLEDNAENSIEETTGNAAASEETTIDAPSENTTETATSSTRILSSTQSDYSKNSKQKTIAEEKITADDVDLLTVKVLYDEVDGNSTYNKFMAEKAEAIVSDYINKYSKEVKNKYNNLARDEKKSFNTYHVEVTFDVTYADDKVISTLCTPAEYIAGSNNATSITALITDATGAKTLTIEDLTDNKVSTDTALELALERFNKKFKDSVNSLQTTRKFQNIYFDFAVNGELTADKINLYLDSNGNYMFYTDRGVVAPYAEGIVIVCIPREEMNRL